MKFKLLFFIIFYSVCSAQSDSIKLTPRLQILLDDMKLYKLDAEGDIYIHAGDLYEHSIWTYNAMWELFRSNSPYVHTVHLTDRQKEVVAFAALLHDVGKAGRIELFDHTHQNLHYDIIKNDQEYVTQISYYQDRRSHPCVGFEYVSKHLFVQDNCAYQKRDYYLINPNTGSLSTFNFQEMYEELGLSQEEQKTVAILIGMHYEFGLLINQTITLEQFFHLLNNYVKAINYNQETLNKLILTLVLLVGIADVKGVTPVAAQPSPLFPRGATFAASHTPIKIENPFITFGYDCLDNTTPLALTVMNNTLSYFYDKN